jgi:hemolysin activation/secretion protein
MARASALVCAFASITAWAQTTSDSDAGAPVPVVIFSVERFEVRGENPLPDAETSAILTDFAGAHEGLEGLLGAADALEASFRRAGFAFHRVNLPGQMLAGGVVILEVTEVTLSAVEVKGNDFSETSTVLASVPSLRAGTSPDARALSRELLLANEHGSRRTNLRFALDPETGGLKGVLDVQERKPSSWFASFANTGSPQTGEYRTTFGYSHSNLFDLDHAVTGSFTTNPGRPSQVTQLGLNYSVPVFQSSGLVRMSWTDSDVSTGLVSGFDVSGAGRFLAISYKQLFAPRGQYRHSLTATLEDKKFIDSTLPVAAPVGINSRSRPVSLRYDASYRHPLGFSAGYVSYSHNIASGNDNDTGTYALRRFGAFPDWHTLKFGGRFSFQFPGAWTLNGRLDVQLANQALIPGEQFGAGGARSVRGYDQRVAGRDSGGVGSLELWAPTWDYGIHFLGFADMGYVKSQFALAGERESEQLSSVGFGARWSYKNQLNVELDWANVLNTVGQLNNVPGDVGVNSKDRTKIHLSVRYRF